MPKSFAGSQPTAASRGHERRANYRRGIRAEHLAAGLLMLKGYRILCRRARTPLGEIDIIARRGRRIAFIEVKRRPSRAEGEAAVAPGQARRIRRAAEHWLSRHPALHEHDIGLDVVLIVPRRWPVHLPDVLNRV